MSSPVICEVVSDALDAAVIGDDAATVAVDQAADEILRRPIDKLLLPWLQPDLPGVFPARTVLREQAWPVLGVEGHNDASLLLRFNRPSLSRHHCVDGVPATVDDAGVFLVQRDPEPPYPPHPRDTAITEVQAE